MSGKNFSMTQLELIPVVTERKRIDYPQVNRVDENNVQWIELNRGCRRGCSFCYADQNYKVFECPEIKSKIVQIIGEGILYDSEIKRKIIELGQKRLNGKVIYYGLSQGIDFRLLTEELAKLLSINRFGIINNKGKWYKGLRFAWDLGMEHKELAKKTIELLESVGYRRKQIQVFVLVNWKISYEVCVEKLNLLKEWGVKIDDCFWNTTKKEKTEHFWSYENLVDFRRKARKHNQLINFDGYDPERVR